MRLIDIRSFSLVAFALLIGWEFWKAVSINEPDQDEVEHGKIILLLAVASLIRVCPSHSGLCLTRIIKIPKMFSSRENSR